ncbi:hypothetical protein [Ancylobacter polymorphus]|uniref:Uncharacterized protein n=1 Tax=Ancylobacter polymorphus TaxID=223390 RepID=A0A9E6ZX13_9HYPH|nr:hypothetical protein [Ancylobacter polymorphus]UOK71697.1 hypothetical protein K9D25_02940 [Ancylobacter polymorphus]
MQPDNDNAPTTKWRETYADLAAESAAHVATARKARETAQRAEAKSCRKAGTRARHRQILGEDWDGEADNDNRSWPLAKALIADGKTSLLRAAMEYRRIEASANSGTLLGGTSLGMEPVQIDQRTWIRPDGEIIYKGERRLTAAAYADVPPTQAGRQTDGMMRPAAPVPKPWSGDEKVNARIDDQRRLARLRSALGPLVECFEAAAVYGETLEQVGRSAGSGNRAGAMGAGKALVMVGLYAVQNELARIRMDETAPSLRAA